MPSQTHNIYVAWSTDSTFTEAELKAGNSTDDGTTTLPAETQNGYIGVWRSDADGGDATNIYINGVDWRTAYFGSATNQSIDSNAGKLMVTNVAQNASVLSGASVRIV